MELCFKDRTLCLHLSKQYLVSCYLLEHLENIDEGSLKGLATSIAQVHGLTASIEEDFIPNDIGETDSRQEVVVSN